MVSAPCLMQPVEYILKLFLVIRAHGYFVHKCAGALGAKNGPHPLEQTVANCLSDLGSGNQT